MGTATIFISWNLVKKLGRRGWDSPPVNFLTEISSGPALTALAFPSLSLRKTRALLRASRPTSLI